MKKCPSSIWSWDLNPGPLEHESLPITNRPGLPSLFVLETWGNWATLKSNIGSHSKTILKFLTEASF